MDRIRLIGLGLVFMVGCGDDPEDSVLAAGSQAVLSVDKEYLMVASNHIAVLKPGVVVRVGKDPGFSEQGAKEFEEEIQGLPPASQKAARENGPRKWYPGESPAKYRDIQVTVESGNYRNDSGKVPRMDLRPIK